MLGAAFFLIGWSVVSRYTNVTVAAILALHLVVTRAIEWRKGERTSIRNEILPVVLGIGGSPELRQLFQSGTGVDGDGFERALELVRAPEVLQAGRLKAAEQAALACGEMSCLKPSVYRECLTAMINDQVHREV